MLVKLVTFQKVSKTPASKLTPSQQKDFFGDRLIIEKYVYAMSDLAKFHDEKYKSSRNAGLPGWGGTDRIANLPKMIDERFLFLESLPRTGRLLELGCGAGNISIELAKRGYEVTGIDFSETAIDWAQENAVSAKAQADFRVADVTNLSAFEAESFDIVFDGNCIHCLVGEKREAAFQEIHRVLKPKGILFVSSLSAPQSNTRFPENFDSQSRVLFENGVPYRFVPSPEFLEREISRVGFEVLQKFIRDGSPFGHTSIHARKSEQ